MTQTSMPWNGVSTGDATGAPYDAPDEWARLWRSISGAATIPTHLSGVFAGELNGLQVTGTATPVSINTGRSLVYGTWYQSDAVETVAIPTPAGATRIDRIVLRKDWALQTVRIVRIAGTEGGPVPPIVQIDGTTWDQMLAQVSITTGGVITVSDERQFIVSGVIGGSAGQVLQPSGGAGLLVWTSNPVIAGTLSFTTVAARIIPGATSISLRNNANSADNLIITDAGVVTLRNQLVISSGGAAITGALTNLTGITSSGNIVFSGLTANRLVVKGATNLESSISSTNMRSSVTDPTGSGSLVFATAPTITTLTISSGGASITGGITLVTGLITLGTAGGVVQGTSDGSDNRNTVLAGGGTEAASRGAFISAYGNESALAGRLIIAAGDGATGTITLQTNNTTRMTFAKAGNVTISAPDSGIGLTMLGTGVSIRIANNSRISGRDVGNTADLNLIGITTANWVDIGDTTVASLSFHSAGNAFSMQLRLGLEVGGPAGGDKGFGTINVSADIYRNNIAYTNPDYVFEHAFTGRIVKYADNPGADSYGGLIPLNDLRDYVRENWRFPGIVDEPTGIFYMADHALRLIEMNTLYLFDHEDRITKLEKVLV